MYWTAEKTIPILKQTTTSIEALAYRSMDNGSSTPSPSTYKMYDYDGLCLNSSTTNEMRPSGFSRVGKASKVPGEPSRKQNLTLCHHPLPVHWQFHP
jgi:hypothetical protein